MSRPGAKCPAGDTLSAFLDGEVLAPWDQAIARHLESCPACSERLARFQRLRERLASDTAPQPWLPPPLERRPRPRPVPFWKRRIALPVPAAAAVALAILALGVVLVAVTGGHTALPWMRIRQAPTGATEVIVAAPIEDLEQLLRNLDQPPRSSELVIQLPADSRFIWIGEPQLVREADFSRGRRW